MFQIKGRRKPLQNFQSQWKTPNSIHKDKTRYRMTIKISNQNIDSITNQAKQLALPQTTDFNTNEDLRVKAMQEATKTMGESLNETIQDSHSCS